MGCLRACRFDFFFPSRLFAAIGSQWAVLLASFQAFGLFLYWPVSRCAKSKGKVHWQVAGGVGGEAAGVCGARGELCKEVTEGGEFAFEIVIGGLGLRKWGWLQILSMPHVWGKQSIWRWGRRCWGVARFGSGEAGDERGGFLAPTASHFDS